MDEPRQTDGARADLDEAVASASGQRALAAASQQPAATRAPGEAASSAASDPSDPTAPVFDAAGDPLPARSFAPGLDDAALGISPAGVRPVTCGWCGTVLADEAARECPICGAALQPQQELPEIPGVNVAPVDVRRAVRTVNPDILALVAPPVADDIARPGTRPALEPPSTSIRLLMLQLELEAQRATASTSAPGAAPAASPGGTDAPGHSAAEVSPARAPSPADATSAIEAPPAIETTPGSAEQGPDPSRPGV